MFSMHNSITDPKEIRDIGIVLASYSLKRNHD